MEPILAPGTLFVELEIEGVTWRVIQPKGSVAKYYSRLGKRFVIRKAPPKHVLQLFFLCEEPPLGGEQ